jgi:hypothetical protein
LRGAPPGPHAGAGAVGGVGEVEQVGSFGAVELQGRASASRTEAETSPIAPRSSLA